MKNWTALSKHTWIKDFYDSKGRLSAVLVHCGTAVRIKCNIEGHYLIADDFLKSDADVAFTEVDFMSDSQDSLLPEALEEIYKKCSERTL